MEFRLAIKDLQNPDDIVALKRAISTIADECDVLYSETAPNGTISARVGRRCVYNNGGTYTFWQNTDGATTWRQITDSASEMWIVDGTETQLRTADEIDMQSKKIINVTDPGAAQDAATQNYVDGKFNTSTGHDHDNSDSKKVLATNLDMTGLTNAHILYNNNGTLAGKAESSGLSNVIFEWHTAEYSDATTSGFLLATTNTNTATNALWPAIRIKGTTDRTILSGKFVKIAGINTITAWAKIWSDSTEGSRETVCKVNVGTPNVTITSITSNTPTWYSGTIDVSGLTNGTTYDITITLANENSDNWGFINSIMLIAS